MLGDPVVQVKSPAAFAAWAAEADRDAVMIPVHVAPQDLPATLQALRGWQNCAGAVITYPHKLAAADALDSWTEAVMLTGACNVVKRLSDGRLEGHMTDGQGFASALASKGHVLTGRDALLVGAGGAGSAIALALLDAGVGRLVIRDRTAARAVELIARLTRARPESAVTATPPGDFACALACNATPVGMGGDPAHPWPLEDLPPGCIVADIVPEPAETPWITAARARGHPIQTGPEMVAGQMPAITSFLFPNGAATAQECPA
ncbi:hypothetical protein RISW2_10870 [Roseivivax isoporae LMG 25204]|uniref:shikimate dehydrogenase (NADP(+)) n=2 Tax=Roseivivax TaxID=93682 RepID=X7F4H8_9RHOB|nr:hypothetical protein RISW2_10870 [Roseivivax isoporae LMG 25204]